MTPTRLNRTLMMLLAVVYAGGIMAPYALSQSNLHATGSIANASGAPAGSSAAIASQAWRMRNSTFFQRNWGVEIIGVRVVSSGHMLEFRYRILDATKAAPVNDKRATPFLIDEKTGARLTVPVMDKVGALRQSSEPKNDQTYWMVFANEGKIVRRGDKVDLSIGKFQAEGIVVD